MAIDENYPSLLPAPRQSGYSIQPGEAVARTDMERGSARQRRTTLSATDEIKVQFLFSRYELSLFEGWYKHKADEGAAYFAIPLLTGMGMVTMQARFKRLEQERPLPGKLFWTVDATLEVRDRPVLSEEAIDVALSEDLEGLLSAIDAASLAVQQGLAVNSPW
ncbi:MAG: hypothetical protein CML19_18215 [Pusillimonas sp.]|jgi:hypothetical protein|nr:hypothetical protein [Pusillimonas sp.]|tara:strand:- start:1217 stop:1705 length:489 start_codon:yes stop_codon:yes gene_type:complete